jgi:signal transduction histidine kinase
MVKKFFWISILLLLCIRIIAQTNFSPAYDININPLPITVLPNNYWQILEDRDGTLSLSDVKSSPISEKFHTNPEGVNNIDYSVRTFWIRYSLKNTLNEKINIGFNNANNADQSDFYFFRNDENWTHEVTGRLYPWKKRSGLKGNNSIFLTINPHEQITVYNRITNNYYVNKPMYLAVEIGSAEEILKQQHIQFEKNQIKKTLEDFFNGILFFAAILNILFYFIVRERLYLYYVLFLAYLLCYFSVWQDFVFRNNLAVYSYFMGLIAPLGIVFYIQFTRYFLRLEEHSRWKKFLNFLCILLVVSNTLSFFLEPYLKGSWNKVSVYFATFVAVFGLLMIMVTFFLFRKKKIKSIKLLFISGLPVLIYETIFRGPRYIFYFISEKKEIHVPKIIQWLRDWDGVINGFLMAWLAIVFSWILFQRFLDLQKRNAQQALEKERLAKEIEIERSRLIDVQKKELEKTVEERTSELKQSLTNLKATQSQLIQSEKMASLGELTAGIAHEIQNPLNFVNNFSDVSKELIEEMKTELDNGDMEHAKDIAGKVIDNLEKILHHGKRADNIVKGMLQHSRTRSGRKELTNINALVDEYFRLAYHGVRAKDKSFKATIKTEYDQNVGSVSIIPGDIGRVILNLVNNAFYAVAEKQKYQSSGYEPTVVISTKRFAGKIELIVKDNGTGIPEKILDKILQPFFTNKPPGQGTGLGLSIAYDMIKAHGGELVVESLEGEYTTCIIQIPINS